MMEFSFEEINTILTGLYSRRNTVNGHIAELTLDGETDTVWYRLAVAEKARITAIIARIMSEREYAS
jgi:hypothetical protein